jgi:hypothetical protein
VILLVILITLMDKIHALHLALIDIKDALKEKAIRESIASYSKELDDTFELIKAKDTTEKLQELKTKVLSLAEIMKSASLPSLAAIDTSSLTQLIKDIEDIQTDDKAVQIVKERVLAFAKGIGQQIGGGAVVGAEIKNRITKLNIGAVDAAAEPALAALAAAEPAADAAEPVASSKADAAEVMQTALVLNRGSPLLTKVNTTLNDLGQRDLAMKALNQIMDESMKKNAAAANHYTFVPANAANQEFSKTLHESYTANFNDEDKKYLQNLMPGSYQPTPPERFQDVLGSQPYFLLGESSKTLHGLDEDPIELEDEEQAALEEGRIPLGALVILYVSCFRDTCPTPSQEPMEA